MFAPKKAKGKPPFPPKKGSFSPKKGMPPTGPGERDKELAFKGGGMVRRGYGKARGGSC